MQRMIEQGKVIFPKNGKGTPQYKRHLSELRNLKKPTSSWIFPANTKDSFIGISSSINSIATKELRNIFNEQIFDYPKPVDLIEGLINQISDQNSIILDSFAGSGTTAHAVINSNKLDGGNRKFILVEMEDYANTITAERVKRVINGYSDKEGTGGSFDYYELGKPLFVGDNSEFLNEEVETEKIREYIWYSETRKAFEKSNTKKDSQYFLGKKEGTAYYFIYEKKALTTLDYDTLSNIKTKEYTRLQFSKVKVNSNLSDSIFTQQNLQKVN